MDLLEHRASKFFFEPISHQAPEETLNQHPAVLSGHTKHHVMSVPVRSMSTF